MKTTLLALSLASASVLAFPLQAADTEKCTTCHGSDGNSSDPHVPSIAGMSSFYLVDALNAYASNDRLSTKYTPAGGSETDMNQIAAKLSSADIDALAKHFSGLSYQPNRQSVDSAMAANGKKLFEKTCDKCHSEAGSIAEDDAGLLLGQGKAYLESQLAMIKAGDRQVPKKMTKQLDKLSDDELKDVIEYLAGGKM